MFKYQELESWLIQQIEAGRFPVGARLPSIRRLCRSHGVSKATAIHALRRLEARGLIVSHAKSGSVVTYAPTPTRLDEAGSLQSPAAARVPDLLLDVMQQRGAFDLLPAAAPEPTTPELVALQRTVSRALRRQGMAVHKYYDEPAGLEELREQLSAWYGKRGCQVEPRSICITSGCQHSIYLALQVCCKAGDIVAVESPGFYGSIQCLEELGIKVLEIPSSPITGMDLEALQKALESWRITACIATPNFATPTGASIPDTARDKLIALARAHQFVVIEDDIYADTAFSERPAPLKTTTPDEPIILCGSFSKSLSRDVRLGWVFAGQWQQRVEKHKLVSLLAGSRGIQLALADFLADGIYATHLRRLVRKLRIQRDQLLSELSGWGADVAFTQPNGGLSLWVQLPPHIDTTEYYDELRQSGIVIMPGTLFSANGMFRNCIRISYEHPWTAERLQALRSVRSSFGF